MVEFLTLSSVTARKNDYLSRLTVSNPNRAADLIAFLASFLLHLQFSANNLENCPSNTLKLPTIFQYRFDQPSIGQRVFVFRKKKRMFAIPLIVAVFHLFDI